MKTSGWTLPRCRRGLVLVEMVAVLGILALLLALGSSVYKGLRLTSRAVVAQNNLRQVGVSMELYFLRYHTYPPQGSNLVSELMPFVNEPAVFSNPLKDEEAPGDTINTLYVAPSFSDVDRPNIYVTAMVAEDGATAVILRTGLKVERRDDVALDLSDPSQMVATLGGASEAPATAYWSPTPPPPATPPPTVEDGFNVTSGGDVTTKVCSDVKIGVLGTQFGYADGTLVDVVVAADIASGMSPLFGGKRVHGGESYAQTSVRAGTRVIIKGEIAGSYERWLWTKYGYPLSYTSNDGSGQVVVLRNGDVPINNDPAFPCQVGVNKLLASCVDATTGRISIAGNEALYCFDFNPVRTRRGIDYNDLVVLATATAAERPCEEEPPPTTPPTPPQEPEQGDRIALTVNLNPSNNMNFEFELVLPDSSKITRDTLATNGADYFYEGDAKSVRFRPKGNGNQNGFYINGVGPTPVRNGTLYTITGKMTVRVYNGKTRDGGRAMGRWWMTLTATSATLTSNR